MLIFRSIVLPQQLIDRLVGSFLSNFPLVGPLFMTPHHMVVDTRVVVVKICHLW